MSTASPAVAAAPPRAGQGLAPFSAAVARVAGSPGRFCLATLAITVAGLALDSSADHGAQAILGLCTAGFLILALVPATPIERAQTAVVVVVASMAEVLGSVVWGVYEYRLGNLPLFVPPGHGLVYLTGLRLSQTAWVRRHVRLFVRLVIGAVAGWALLGLVVLERLDVAGAVGAAVLVGFLIRGRAPAVYSGVFVAVAFLELYGTWVGTWTWAEHVPGLGVPDGNPPSGAASGYVLFDICALALAPWLLATAGRLRPRGRSLLRVGNEEGPARLRVAVAGGAEERHLGGPLGRGPVGLLGGRGHDGVPADHVDLPAHVGEVEREVVQQVGRAHQQVAERAGGARGRRHRR